LREELKGFPIVLDTTPPEALDKLFLLLFYDPDFTFLTVFEFLFYVSFFFSSAFSSSWHLNGFIRFNAL